jgi:DNA polymerase III alpha subunit
MFQLNSHAWGHINHRLKPLNKTNIVSLSVWWWPGPVRPVATYFGN